MKRCQWALSTPLEQVYHDNEWGVPLGEDRRLFEFLILEGAQAGLSWSTILNKREGYRNAFDHFDPQAIAQYSTEKITALLSNPAIIRNRLKITAAISNAQAFIKIQTQYGSFSTYIWQFVDGIPIQNHWDHPSQIPAATALSKTMSTELKAKGFKFVGPTICYAFMQAVGMVNDHTTDCFRHTQIKKLSPQPRPLSELMNIGKAIEERLNEIGVFTKKNLVDIGPVDAYRQIEKNYPNETLPLCYYLYSLEGAIKDIHWNAIGEDRKKALKDLLD